MRFAKTLLLAAALLGTGCARNPTDKLVGMWRIDGGSFKTGNARVDSEMATVSAQMSINIKSGATFVMGNGDQGTLALEGKTVTFTLTKTAGADAKQTGSVGTSITATLNADDSSFSINNPSGKAMAYGKQLSA